MSYIAIIIVAIAPVILVAIFSYMRLSAQMIPSSLR